MISASLNGQEDQTRRDAEIKTSKVQKNPPSLRSEAWICAPPNCNCTTVCVCVCCAEEARLHSQRGDFKRAAADRRQPEQTGEGGRPAGDEAPQMRGR